MKERVMRWQRLLFFGLVLIILLVSIGACGNVNKVDDNWTSRYFTESIELEGETLEEYNSLRHELFCINRQLGSEYESYDEAMELEASEYEQEGDSESLFRVCLILYYRYNAEENWDSVIKYYSDLMEKMKNDTVLREFINIEHRDYIDIYLKTLKYKEMRDKYRKFFINIEDYIIDVNDIVLTTIMFLQPQDEADLSDYEFFLKLFKEYEERYAGQAERKTDMLIYKAILDFAEKLDEEELAEEYNEKFETIYAELSELD